MAMAIAHMENQVVMLDCLRERQPPFSPERVVSEFAQLLKSYNITTVVGDRFGGLWPVEQFGRFNIRFEQAAKAKSELYIDALALLNSRRVDLLDNNKLAAQLCGLERRVSRSGRKTIDHAPGGHDDLANCVAGVASLCVMQGLYDWRYDWVTGPDRGGEDAFEAARARHVAARTFRRVLARARHAVVVR
jgi:hypothetical protein